MLDPKVQACINASEEVWYDYKLDTGAFYAWLWGLSLELMPFKRRFI